MANSMLPNREQLTLTYRGLSSLEITDKLAEDGLTEVAREVAQAELARRRAGGNALEPPPPMPGWIKMLTQLPNRLRPVIFWVLVLSLLHQTVLIMPVLLKNHGWLGIVIPLVGFALGYTLLEKFLYPESEVKFLDNLLGTFAFFIVAILGIAALVYYFALHYARW